MLVGDSGRESTRIELPGMFVDNLKVKGPRVGKRLQQFAVCYVIVKEESQGIETPNDGRW